MATNPMDEVTPEVLELPGFRFHPTEEELLDFYLKNMVFGKMRFDIIGSLNIYLYDPWVLPGTYFTINHSLFIVSHVIVIIIFSYVRVLII